VTLHYVGLCATCRHGHWIVSGRGSRFLRCQKSFEDPSFPRYPQLPVLACDGYEPRSGAEEDTGEDEPLPPDTER